MADSYHKFQITGLAANAVLKAVEDVALVKLPANSVRSIKYDPKAGTVDVHLGAPDLSAYLVNLRTAIQGSIGSPANVDTSVALKDSLVKTSTDRRAELSNVRR